METNAFYDKVIADDPEIDLYQGFWNTGSNPDPTGFYGKYEAFNMLRFASPELDKHLANIVTMDNTDPNVRLQHYVELSKYMVTDEAVVIPLFAGTKKVFVNNRVKKYDISNAEKDKAPFRTSEIELTKDAPEVGK